MAEVKELKLEAITFRGAPTERQMQNALHDIQVFLNRSLGAMLFEEFISAENPKSANTFGAIAAINQAEKVWGGDSNLAVPQVQQSRPQMVR